MYEDISGICNLRPVITCSYMFGGRCCFQQYVQPLRKVNCSYDAVMHIVD